MLNAALPHFKGARKPRLIVRTMRSRWGSLSRAGTITLNVNLVRAPRPCIDYVVTHELCHIQHRDHDAHFFRLLGRAMPDWEQRKQRLEAALLGDIRGDEWSCQQESLWPPHCLMALRT